MNTTIYTKRKRTELEIIPEGELFAGRLVSVEVYRDDAGYVIMARAELLPQRTPCPGLGLSAFHTEINRAENRLKSLCHSKGNPAGPAQLTPEEVPILNTDSTQKKISLTQQSPGNCSACSVATR